ncbi:hypothetical protein [Actinophytocola gossypii]|uniref:Uncharacterized protein n=1 Tax=Actinophytocola gossypii TaxID=2812003 RepID=A0ABT2J8W5_9PSEU|nr:hypothetical protein [Actinophytocola gossypii]MCT2584312.1 hypothetical protein [Actinophytocola gossypii]
MRSAELALGRLENQRHLPSPTLQTPKSFGTTPVVFAPHPPLVSGGWYKGADQEIHGPGRYPMPRPVEKRAGSALLWTFFLGPLGLCYLSPAAGLGVSALTAIVLAVSWNLQFLAVVWPLVMVLAVLVATNRR